MADAPPKRCDERAADVRTARACAECGATFLPQVFWQRYCADACRRLAFMRRKVARAAEKP